MKTPSKITYVLMAILFFIIGTASGFAGFFVYEKITLKSDVLSSGDLSIHFLELGNNKTGDSVYIKCGENDILIDAGSENSSASTIINYVDQFVTDNTLEYVIATHAHEDHIAGFYDESDRTGIFSHYEVEYIIDFPNTNKENPSATSVLGKYISARDAEVEAGAKHYTALECYNNENGASRTIELSKNVELEILYNYYYDHSYSSGENNFSVCAMINQGENHYLFTGDLEESGEKKLVTYYDENHGGLPHCVVYKAGHHGSGTSSCSELMEAISPEIVCVCACAGTSEYTDNAENQFPYQTFIDNVARYTSKIYVTSVVDNYVDKSNWSKEGTVKSMNGNIVVTSKNGKVEVNCSNNNTILKETDWFKNNRTWPNYGVT